ncbi:hypothetical protein [Thiobacillus sp.]
MKPDTEQSKAPEAKDDSKSESKPDAKPDAKNDLKSLPLAEVEK